jgi:hypothetical protein
VSYHYALERYSYDYAKAIQVEMPEVDAPLWRESAENTTTGVAGHGLSGYRWRKCRCEICRGAKAASARKYRARRRSP